MKNIIIFIGAILVAARTHGATVDLEHLTLEQRESVTNLRTRLNAELGNGYAMEDFELVQWLQGSHFNVEETSKKVEVYLQARRELKIDQILNEDWSDLRVLFPYSRDAIDKSGKPVVYISMGDWNLARYLTSQEASDRLMRYILMIQEDVYAKVKSLRVEGRNVTQISKLINIGGFSIEKHVCIQCAYFYRDVTTKFASLRDFKQEKVVFINVPYAFKMIYVFLSDEAQGMIQLYGQDHVELEKLLDSYIDKSQLPKGILENLSEKDNSYGSIVWKKEL